MALLNEQALDSLPILTEAANTYHSGHFRRLLKALLASSGSGIVGSGDFLVTANPTPDQAVYPAAGTAVVIGSMDTLHEGAYVAEGFTQKRIPLDPSDPTNDRIDRILLGAYNQEYQGSRYAAVVGSVKGTPSGAPVAPSMPTDGTFLELAQVRVRHGSSTIISTDITDTRTPFGLGSPFLMAKGYGGPFTQAGRRLGRMTTVGPPATGTWQAGDWGFDSVGGLWQCVAAGTPGTWYATSSVKFATAAPTGTTFTQTIPSGFRSVTIKWRARDASAGTSANSGFLTLNGGATGYQYVTSRSDVGPSNPAIESANAATSFANAFCLAGGGQAASVFAHGVIEIPILISGAYPHVTWSNVLNNPTGTSKRDGGGDWEGGSGPVTSLTFATGGAAFASGSIFDFYGDV